MIIETERLEIILLSSTQLKLWVEDISSLEKQIDATYMAEPLEGFFLEIVKKQVIKTINDPKNYMWHSFWFLIRKSDRVVVGSADFKDVPNENCEVEIGYGLDEKFEHNGYMTEAVKAMCNWAINQKTVKHVIAETDIDGFASQRILQRCNFSQYKKGETLWWKL